MGALFSFFDNNEVRDFELNWNNAATTDNELFTESQQFIENLKQLQQSLQTYENAQNDIKAAMSAKTDSPDYQPKTRTAFEKTIRTATLCKQWMLLCQEISLFFKDKLFPHITKTITNNTDNKENEEKHNLSETTILTNQTLTNQAVVILNHILICNEIKMTISQLQNDFAYYKRMLAKSQTEQHLQNFEIPVDSEQSSHISMFLAYAIPSLKEIANNLKDQQTSLNILATLSNAILDLLRANKFVNHLSDAKIAVRAMLAALIIYDHSNANGAYQRRSITKAQKIVQMIATDYEATYGNKDDVSGLTNIIKFSSLTYNDAPNSVKRLLGD